MIHLNSSQNTPDASPNATEIIPCPQNIPQKFWDPITGTVRVDDLVQSYRELEKRFMTRKTGSPPDVLDSSGDKNVSTDSAPHTSDPHQNVATVPETRDALLKQLGRPNTPHDYHLSVNHPYLTLDPDLNARFHALGFTNDQVQFIYDVAVDRLVPLILDLVADQQAEHDVGKMIDAFGGGNQWQETARQIQAFARKNFPPDLVNHLSTSFDGIMMIYKMMISDIYPDAPPTGTGTSAQTDTPGLDRIRNMMRDPRYWRDHDPKIIEKVTAGFSRLYGS